MTRMPESSKGVLKLSERDSFPIMYILYVPQRLFQKVQGVPLLRPWFDYYWPALVPI